MMALTLPKMLAYMRAGGEIKRGGGGLKRVGVRGWSEGMRKKKSERK